MVAAPRPLAHATHRHSPVPGAGRCPRLGWLPVALGVAAAASTLVVVRTEVEAAVVAPHAVLMPAPFAAPLAVRVHSPAPRRVCTPVPGRFRARSPPSPPVLSVQRWEHLVRLLMSAAQAQQRRPERCAHAAPLARTRRRWATQAACDAWWRRLRHRPSRRGFGGARVWAPHRRWQRLPSSCCGGGGAICCVAQASSGPCCVGRCPWLAPGGRGG